MITPALNTILKMLEGLPEATQNDILEHLRIYIAELDDRQKWDQAYTRTQPQLTEAARRARRQISELRALGVLEQDTVTWFWIGSHDDDERYYG